MALKAFDHVNVVTANLQKMVAWYVDVLGLESGWRPNFPFPGAWIYLGDLAVVHLVGSDHQPKSVEPQIEHFAFSAKGLPDFLARMEQHGVKCDLAEVPGTDITQVNIFDPDGNHLHIDFREKA